MGPLKGLSDSDLLILRPAISSLRRAKECPSAPVAERSCDVDCRDTSSMCNGEPTCCDGCGCNMDESWPLFQVSVSFGGLQKTGKIEVTGCRRFVIPAKAIGSSGVLRNNIDAEKDKLKT